MASLFNYKQFLDSDVQQENQDQILTTVKSDKDLLNDAECEKFENEEALQDSFQNNPFGFDKTLEEKEKYLLDNVSQISLASENPYLGARINSQESLAGGPSQNKEVIIITPKIADRYRRLSNEAKVNQYSRLNEQPNIMERLEESEFRRRRRSSIVNLGQKFKRNVSKIFTGGKTERRKSQLQESLIVSPKKTDN